MTTHLGLQRILLPSAQVSQLTTGSITLPSAGQAFIPPSFFESIQTVTATGSGSETLLTFTSIPQTYKHLQIRGLGRYMGNSLNFAVGLRVRLNGSSSSIYARQQFSGDGTSTGATAYLSDFIDIGGAAAGGGVASNIFGACIIDLFDYSSTTKNKTLHYFAGMEKNSGGTDQKFAIGMGGFYSTSAITSISVGFTDAGGAAAAGSVFSLYGIKG